MAAGKRPVTQMKASDLMVQRLREESIEYVFGVPGEA